MCKFLVRHGNKYDTNDKWHKYACDREVQESRSRAATFRLCGHVSVWWFSSLCWNMSWNDYADGLEVNNVTHLHCSPSSSSSTQTHQSPSSPRPCETGLLGERCPSLELRNDLCSPYESFPMWDSRTVLIPLKANRFFFSLISNFVTPPLLFVRTRRHVPFVTHTTAGTHMPSSWKPILLGLSSFDSVSIQSVSLTGWRRIAGNGAGGIRGPKSGLGAEGCVLIQSLHSTNRGIRLCDPISPSLLVCVVFFLCF